MNITMTIKDLVTMFLGYVFPFLIISYLFNFIGTFMIFSLIEVEKPPYTLQKKARNEFDVSVILHHVNHQQIKLNYRIGSKARKENFSINFPINTKSLVVEIPNR